MYYEKETEKSYQEKLSQLQQLGLTDCQIGEMCSTVITVCAIGVDDPSTSNYTRLTSLLPVSIDEKHPFYILETEEFEDFASHYLSGGYGQDKVIPF